MEVANACRVANHWPNPTRWASTATNICIATGRCILAVTLYGSPGATRSPMASTGLPSAVGAVQRRPDGSLDLRFQNDNPGKEEEVNWLPATKGPFNLTMRLYAPLSEALTGK